MAGLRSLVLIASVLVAAALVPTSGSNLYVASVDGTQVERITDDADGTLYRPSVSPDSRWIACDGYLEGSGDGVIGMRADGTGLRRITSAKSELHPDLVSSWSPDSERILFAAYRGRLKGAGVYVVDRKGQRLRRLSNAVR